MGAQHLFLERSRSRYSYQFFDIHSYLIQFIVMALQILGNQSGRIDKKKEVFHLRCIRGILGISWDNMREGDVFNIQVSKNVSI